MFTFWWTIDRFVHKVGEVVGCVKPTWTIDRVVVWASSIHIYTLVSAIGVLCQCPFSNFAEMTITTSQNHTLLYLDAATNRVRGLEPRVRSQKERESPPLRHVQSDSMLIIECIYKCAVILWDNPRFQSGMLRLPSANFAYCDFNIGMIPCCNLIFLDNLIIL